MGRIFTILLLVFTNLLFLYNIKCEDNYQSKYNISNQKCTIIVLLDPISCIKCKLNIDKVINYINNKLDNSKYDIIGFLRVERKVEFNYYKKNLEYNYPLYPIDEKLLKKIGINPQMDFMIIEPSMKIIYQNNFSEYNDVSKECENIIKLIKNKSIILK